MEKIGFPYPNKEFKIEEIWIDLSKQSIWKMKEIKIKTIQIPGISNSLKFWNFWSKHKVSDPTLDAFDIGNLILKDNVEDYFSTQEELENDGDGDDIGDDFIRELMDIWTISMFLKCFYFKNLCFILYEFMFDWVCIILVYWIIVKVWYFDLF